MPTGSPGWAVVPARERPYDDPLPAQPKHRVVEPCHAVSSEGAARSLPACIGGGWPAQLRCRLAQARGWRRVRVSGCGSASGNAADRRHGADFPVLRHVEFRGEAVAVERTKLAHVQTEGRGLKGHGRYGLPEVIQRELRIVPVGVLDVAMRQVGDQQRSGWCPGLIYRQLVANPRPKAIKPPGLTGPRSRPGSLAPPPEDRPWRAAESLD